MSKVIVSFLFFLTSLPLTAVAESENAKVLYENISLGGGKYNTKVIALINMDDVFDRPMDNCTQIIDTIKVAGIQFSSSGNTLESFWYTEGGHRTVVPTNIGNNMGLSNADKAQANSFIKIGKRYLAHIQVCGSGGFHSLISLYAL